jgi:hypothetical protein
MARSDADEAKTDPRISDMNFPYRYLVGQAVRVK